LVLTLDLSKEKQQQTLEPIVNDYINIPNKLITKQQNIVLCIHKIKVNGLLFSTTISKNIHYCIAQDSESKTMQNYKKALVAIIQPYNKAGF
jgi:hypothetical protein